MLACARTCGRRNTSHFLTFGEFCVFAGELRRGGRGRPHHNQVQRTSSKYFTFIYFVNSLICNNNYGLAIRMYEIIHIWHLYFIAEPISHCEVFLGGSCNPTTWRADVAIPALSKLGISYYNPVSKNILDSCRHLVKHKLVE